MAFIAFHCMVLILLLFTTIIYDLKDKKDFDRICGKTDLKIKKDKKIETYYNRIKYKIDLNDKKIKK